MINWMYRYPDEAEAKHPPIVTRYGPAFVSVYVPVGPLKLTPVVVVAVPQFVKVTGDVLNVWLLATRTIPYAFAEFNSTIPKRAGESVLIIGSEPAVWYPVTERVFPLVNEIISQAPIPVTPV